jgi:hypothetical protein
VNTPQIAIKNLHIHFPPVIGPFPDIEKIASDLLSKQATNKAETAPGSRFVLIADGQIIVDNSTGFWWPVNDSEYSLDHDDATAYCRDFRLGDYDDWFMPGRFDVEGILDLDRHKPCLPPVFKTHGGYTWTNTQTPWTKNNTGASRSFFLVSMDSGLVDYSHANSSFRVRPVRVGGAVPAGQ